MKKKNVLTLALSLTLVAVVAIGGTLAYLTAAPDQVTNTFTFIEGFDDDDPEATGIINVKLTESDPNANEALMGVASATQNATEGYDYADVVPNQVLPKDPTVSVKTKVDSWVFVKIEEGEHMSVVDLDTVNWTAIDEDEGIYAYNEMVEANTDWEPLTAVFTQVQVENLTDTENVELGDVVVSVAAVQDDGFTTVQDAYQAFVDSEGSFVAPSNP